jgi:hypothetical protein
MRYFVLCLILFVGAGCTDAYRSQFDAYGAKHRVEFWSGGQKVHEWISTGKVLSERESDGYFFMDSETKKLVRITGDLVITPIE